MRTPSQKATVLGSEQPVQRCRAHKLRNVLERIPKEERPPGAGGDAAAWRLEWKEGMAKLKKLSEWLEGDYPVAASSPLEGLEELLHHQPSRPAAFVALATTNLIESPQSRVRSRTRRVTR